MTKWGLFQECNDDSVLKKINANHHISKLKNKRMII